jgi:hypothetical protein
MWGTSSPDDKLTVVLGNLIEATKIAGPQSDRLMARKLSPGNFGLLQQYLPLAAVSRCSNECAKPDLLDHLVGSGKQRRGHDEAERLGGLEINH